MFEVVATYVCIHGRGVGVGLAVEHWCLHIHRVCVVAVRLWVLSQSYF